MGELSCRSCELARAHAVGEQHLQLLPLCCPSLLLLGPASLRGQFGFQIIVIELSDSATKSIARPWRRKPELPFVHAGFREPAGISVALRSISDV